MAIWAAIATSLAVVFLITALVAILICFLINQDIIEAREETRRAKEEGHVQYLASEEARRSLKRQLQQRDERILALRKYINDDEFHKITEGRFRSIEITEDNHS